LRRCALISHDSFGKIFNICHCLVTDERGSLFSLIFERLLPFLDTNVRRITLSDHDSGFVACARDASFSAMFPHHSLYLCTKHAYTNATEQLQQRASCMSKETLTQLRKGLGFCMFNAEADSEV